LSRSLTICNDQREFAPPALTSASASFAAFRIGGIKLASGPVMPMSAPTLTSSAATVVIADISNSGTMAAFLPMINLLV